MLKLIGLYLRYVALGATIFLWTGLGMAQPPNSLDFDRIVDAIYISEGGIHTKYPFGIKSVKCHGYDECRQICANTVVNNYKRWEEAGHPGQFIDYLADRYVPIKSDMVGNINWKRNMKRILKDYVH